MGDCIVCGESTKYICMPCKLLLCGKHKIIHENRTIKAHRFSKFTLKSSSKLSESSVTQIPQEIIKRLNPPYQELRESFKQPNCKSSEAAKSLSNLKSMNLEAIKNSLEQEHHIFLNAHLSNISKILLTSDNKYIISASKDTTIRIWNFKSIKQEAVLSGHIGPVTTIGITDDNKYIISGSKDTTIRIWSLPDRIQESILQRHTTDVHYVSVTSDNKYIISASIDCTIGIWNLRDRILEAVLDENSKISKLTSISNDSMIPRKIITISKDGKLIVSCCNNAIFVWNIPEKRKESNLTPKTFDSEYICSLAVTTDNELIFAGYSAGDIIIWNHRKCTRPFSLRGHYRKVKFLAITRYNEFLISASKEIRIWSIRLRVEKFLLTDVVKFVTCLVVTDENHIIFASGDNAIRIWSLKQRKPLAVLQGHSAKVKTISISSDNNYIVSGSNDLTVRVWSIKQKRLKYIMPGHNQQVMGLSITSDGRYIASASLDRTVRLWNVKDKMQEGVIEGHRGSVRITADDKYIVSGSDDGTVRVWKIKKRNQENGLHVGARSMKNMEINSDWDNLKIKNW